MIVYLIQWNKGPDVAAEASYYNRSLERALQIVSAFSTERQSMTLGGLSETLRLPKATVLRLCATLMKYDFLRHDKDSKSYSLGLKLFELGAVVFSSFSLRKVASVHLITLQSRLWKTVFLGILQDDELVYIDKKESLDNPIRFASHVGTRRPPHFGMLGQALMAYLPADETERLMKKSPLTATTRKSITDEKAFRERLRKVREQGYAIDDAETIEGITGVAVPIRDFSGKVMAAVGVSFISSSENARSTEKIIKEMRKTAHDISQEMGHLGRGGGFGITGADGTVLGSDES
jgi:IclR family KDG regulon transcriptional repressor